MKKSIMVLVAITALALNLRKTISAYGLSRLSSRSRTRLPVLMKKSWYRFYPRPWMNPVASQQLSEQQKLRMATSSENEPSVQTAFGMIPTIEQLRSDPFMKQVRHAEFIVGLFDEDAGRCTNVLMDRLRAQLSQPDGIRGFMVTFLTTVSIDFICFYNNNNYYYW
jgi:hypothetical protein